VALLSVGEESEKGTALVKQTRELLREEQRVNFVGNVEGREIFDGVCDVALCDGFVGNLMLKFVEGVAEGFIYTLRREFEEQLGTRDEATHNLVQSALERVWARHDYSEYGGAPLLGVDGVCIICHGRSSPRAIRQAVSLACTFMTSDLNRAVAEGLAPSEQQ
jgi:glycerol-3-phosphate acyltransferase PlsX